MARTAEGAALTDVHRNAQLQLRARALRDYMILWPLWQGDETTFQQLLQATLPLIRSYHSLSAALAASYYTSFRAAEREGGNPTPRLATPPDEARVLGTLHLVGMDMTSRALAAGQSPQAAMRSALVRTSGTTTQFVLEGGRETVLGSVGEDPRSRGWARVTSGKPCAFCVTLASRGAVYKEDTVGFRSHGHCVCTAEPQYGESVAPGFQEHRDTYERAQQWAREHPEDAPDGTSNDALNNVRRFMALSA